MLSSLSKKLSVYRSNGSLEECEEHRKQIVLKPYSSYGRFVFV